MLRRRRGGAMARALQMFNDVRTVIGADLFFRMMLAFWASFQAQIEITHPNHAS